MVKQDESRLSYVSGAPTAPLLYEIRRDFCHGRIAHYKILAIIKYVDEFPMTVTGKIQKHLMREQVVEIFNLVSRENRIAHATQGDLRW